jgi:hypothetical protein
MLSRAFVSHTPRATAPLSRWQEVGLKNGGGCGGIATNDMSRKTPNARKGDTGNANLVAFASYAGGSAVRAAREMKTLTDRWLLVCQMRENGYN